MAKIKRRNLICNVTEKGLAFLRANNRNVEDNEEVCIGVDPGKDGGIVVVYPPGFGADNDFIPVGDIEDILDSFVSISRIARAANRGTYAFIEEATGYIGNGQPGAYAFKFGMNYGVLLAGLVAAGIPYRIIRPQEWQSALGVGHRRNGESKSSWKNRLKVVAESLFATDLTKNVSDAALVAYYCSVQRRIEREERESDG